MAQMYIHIVLDYLNVSFKVWPGTALSLIFKIVLETLSLN